MLIIGEKIHIISPKVKEALAARDGAHFAELAREQLAAGASALDLNVGPQKKAGPEVMSWLVDCMHDAVGDVTLSLEPPAGSARNVLAGAIAELVPEPPAGDRVRVLLATRPSLAATVSRAAVDAMELARGTVVHASFKATAVRLLPD